VPDISPFYLTELAVVRVGVWQHVSLRSQLQRKRLQLAANYYDDRCFTVGMDYMTELYRMLLVVGLINASIRAVAVCMT